MNINLLRGPHRLRTLVGGSNRPRPSFMATLVLGTVSANNQAGTFTRATAASYPDWEGVIRYAISGQSTHPGCRVVKNLVSSINVSTWTQIGTCSVTSGVSDPNGGTSAYTLTAGAAVSGRVLANSVSAGASVRNSIWVRRRTGTGQIDMYTGGDSSNRTTVTPAITTSWQRIATDVMSQPTATNNFIGFYIVTSGDEIDVCFPQTENVTGQSNQAPGEYLDPSTQYGMNVAGVQGFATQNGNTVASNVVTAGTGAAISASTLLGYRSEEARTNRCLQNQDKSNASWTKTSVTVSAATAPDGQSKNIRCTATGANGTILQAITDASAARIYSAYVKRVTGTGNIDITIDSGATWTTISGSINSSTFTVVSRAQTLANPTVGFRIVTSGDAVDIYLDQEETGAFVTSAIPTTTVAVTRNLDLDAYATSGNVNTNNVTISGTWTPNAAVASMGTTYIWGSYVDANNYTHIFHDGTNIIARKRIGGVNTDATKALAYAAGTSYIIAARFSASSGIDIFVNGVIGTNSANTAALQLGATFQLLADGNGVVAGTSELKNDRIYGVALSDAQVAQIPA